MYHRRRGELQVTSLRPRQSRQTQELRQEMTLTPCYASGRCDQRANSAEDRQHTRRARARHFS